MHLDDSQRDFISSSSSRMRLLAPAGSGKTQCILQRAARLLLHAADAQRRILVVTFTRAARDELAHRITTDAEYAPLRPSVRVDTLNRWGYAYLRNQQAGLALKSSSVELYSLMAHNLKPLLSTHPRIALALKGKKNRYAEFLGLLDAMKEAGFVHRHPTGVVARFVNHLEWLGLAGLRRFFVRSIEEPLTSLGVIDDSASTTYAKWEALLRFWSEACDHLWDSAIITLDDQKYWARLKLMERFPPGSLFPEPNRYHHVFVDEFQDVSPLDVALIRELVRVNNSSLTIVGDDDQAIFEWRGSSPSFIIEPSRYLDGEFETHRLATNYRSPRNIVEVSQRLIRHNQHREDKPVAAQNQSVVDIDVIALDDHAAAVQHCVELAFAAHSDGEPGSLAVVTRKKCQLIPLEIALTSRSISYYAREDLNVLLSDAFEDLKAVLYAAASQHTKCFAKSAVDTVIKCCQRVTLYPLRAEERKALWSFLMSGNPHSVWECIQRLAEYHGAISGVAGEAGLSVAVAIGQVLEATTVAEAIRRVQENFPGLQKHWAKSADDIFYKDPPFVHLAEYASAYGSDFVSFVEHVDMAIASMGGAAVPLGDEPDAGLLLPVHLMTALRAKGKEFRTVVLLDVVDGIWPIRHAKGIAELEQERRLFYVAVTRAMQRLVLMPVRSLLGQAAAPSPYLAEMGLPGAVS